MSTSDIREAFETRIAAFAAAQNPPLPVAWENVSYTPSPATGWLQVALLPGVTVNPALGVRFDRLVGFFQVNVYAIQDGGPAAAEAIADAILDLFPRGSLTQNGAIINIDTTGSRAQGMNDENGFYFIPVRIRYREDVIG